MKKKEKLRKRLYKMVDGFIEVCDLDSEYYLVEKNDYTTKIMEQEVRDMASNIELDKAREEVIKNLIKKIEEANCDSISLELLREINLSKLTTK